MAHYVCHCGRYRFDRVLFSFLKGNAMKYRLTQAYWDYVNNYLTVEKWAEHNGLTVEQAQALLAVMRDIANTPHPEA